jgi:hypothetical protein
LIAHFLDAAVGFVWPVRTRQSHLLREFHFSDGDANATNGPRRG